MDRIGIFSHRGKVNVMLLDSSCTVVFTDCSICYWDALTQWVAHAYLWAEES
ncbi:MAG: hypothetical protein RDV48_01290 [Candidatus Eremiobacteraeota bacterium]|nr:hypothetical protein [Candidatus Eremiobacteraeota bacterium]